MALIDETYRPRSDDHRSDVERAEAALLDPANASIVEVVLRADRHGDPDAFEAVAVDGRVRFRRSVDERTGGWSFTEEAVEGRNPLGDQALDRFSPLEDERSNPFPDRPRTSYPHAYEQVA